MTNKNKKLVSNTPVSNNETSFKKILKRNLKEVISDFLALCKWLIIATIVGLVVGSFSSIFAYIINFVTWLRGHYSWLLFLLPLGGIIIITLYSLCELKQDPGTNLVISSINKDRKIPLRMAPLIFVATTLTHLFGGSAGRAGATLQIGGSIGNSLGYIFKFDDSDKKVFTMCGMSAAFAAVFGTPMTATLFALEVGCIGSMYYSALVPCIFSSLIASSISLQLGIKPESFTITKLFALNFPNILKVILIALACSAISSLFCYTLRKTHKLFNKLINNPYIRIIVVACLIILINTLLQTTDYMGAGSDVIKKALDGNAAPYSFIIKLLLTAMTIGAGFKGGEIFPSFFIGATLGCTLGNLLNISPSLCAALGMIGLFCGVTNCPITSALISFEFFGYKAIPFFLIVVSISYMMSGYNSLYTEQNVLFKKTKAKSV